MNAHIPDWLSETALMPRITSELSTAGRYLDSVYIMDCFPPCCLTQFAYQPIQFAVTTDLTSVGGNAGLLQGSRLG